MIKRLIIFYFFIFGLIIAAYAQNENPRKGVNIYADTAINGLIQRHVIHNQKGSTLEGYRVQIFFDSGNNARKNSNDIRLKFMETHQGVEAYLSFQQPYFKVRVGDFRTRIEAERFKKIIEAEYPNCFVIKDIIEYPKFK